MANYFSALDGENYISLTTFRKSGKPVPTPIWFVEHNDKLYGYTQTSSGKVKRIRHTPEVTIAACDARGNVHGETIEAQVNLLDDSQKGFVLNLMNQKYGILRRLFGLMQWVQRADLTYLEITPRQ